MATLGDHSLVGTARETPWCSGYSVKAHPPVEAKTTLSDCHILEPGLVRISNSTAHLYWRRLRNPQLTAQFSGIHTVSPCPINRPKVVPIHQGLGLHFRPRQKPHKSRHKNHGRAHPSFTHHRRKPWFLR